jgi:hypothetical protein
MKLIIMEFTMNLEELIKYLEKNNLEQIKQINFCLCVWAKKKLFYFIFVSIINI